MQELKEKLKDFFYYIDNEENPNVDKTIEKFKEIFKDEYFESMYYINEAYYDYKEKNLYLKNSNGIRLDIVSGEWDRYGNSHSHDGVDIYITSKLSKSREIRSGVDIFIMNEYQNIKLSNLLDQFFNVDLSYESLVQNKDNNVYKTLPESVINRDDIVKARYNQLKRESEKKNKDEVEYDLISPYGGLDVTIHSIPQLLYNKILNFKEDKYFYDRAMALFRKDFGEYLDNEINTCKDALYIISHKNEYKDILENDYQILLHYDYTPEIDIDKVKKDKEKNEQELRNLRKEYKILTNKNYSILDIILGTKIMNQRRMLQLYNPKFQSGLIAEYEKKLLDNELDENCYNTYKEYADKLEKRKQELKIKVDRPFKNFTIKEDYSTTINGKYFYIESLDRLIEKEDFYTKKLNELEHGINVAEQHIEILEEKQIETTQEMEIAM